MKKPHYFCDFCGKEVPGEAKLCPHCGRFFTSVRCPRCGFTATAAKFKFGCPSCGYSSPGQGGPGAAVPGSRTRKRRGAAAPGPLPVWVFLVVGVLLVFSIGGLIILCHP
jgi:hypothetical protein